MERAVFGHCAECAHWPELLIDESGVTTGQGQFGASHSHQVARAGKIGPLGGMVQSGLADGGAKTAAVAAGSTSA